METHRYGILRTALVCCALVLPVLSVAETLPPVASIEEAKDRLRFLDKEAGRTDEWVESNWEGEFESRYPSLPRTPRAPKETEKAFQDREMRTRMAVSELKRNLRRERDGWLKEQREALLSQEIPEGLPVHLGSYDAERGEYPVLLGFGWPAGVSIRCRVREGDKKAFEQNITGVLTGIFRINAKEEVSLLSLGRICPPEDALLSVLPPGPRLLWEGSHQSWVTSVAFRPDGERFLSGGGDGALVAWDTGTGNRIFHLPDVEMALSASFSPDGSEVATGGTDSVLRVRRADTGREVWRETAGGMIFSVDYSPDGKYIATGDDGGLLRVWNSQSGKEVVRLDLGSSVRAVDFTPGGRTIAAGGEGNFVVLWNMATGRQVWRKEVGWTVLSISAGGGESGLIAAGGAGNRLVALREADGVEAWNVDTKGEVRAVRFDPAGRLLAYGGAGYSANVLLGEKGNRLWTASIGSPVRALAFGPAGMKLVVGSADFAVRLFEVDEGDRVTLAIWKYGRVYVDRSRVQKLFRN